MRNNLKFIKKPILNKIINWQKYLNIIINLIKKFNNINRF